MRYLPPLHLREKYFTGVESEIQKLFNDLIYHPLTKILLSSRPSELLNSMRALVAAIERGTVWYEDGQFKGKFSSRITKELREIGAHFNPPSRSWSLKRDAIPVELRFAQAAADARYDALRHDLLTALDDMDIQALDTKSNIAGKYAQALDQMEMDFRKSVSAVEAVSIIPTLTENQRNRIAEEYSTNLNLYIKSWAEQNILKLRQEIQAPALAGRRAEALVKTLQDNYGVSKSKAKFLARQETALLMSKYQETRYGDLGIEQYKWSTSHDERVRPDHKALDGKIFRFDQPPITDKRTGARNNPGQDFNCRCIAIPVIN